MKSAKQKAKEKAWKEFSRYIRLKHSDEGGYCNCVTCGAKLPWKKMQAGHFIDSRCNSVLFNEKIVYPQCVGCNMFLNGNKIKYFLFMLKNYTAREIEEFENLKHTPLQYKLNDYLEIADMYKSKADALLGEKV